MNDRPPLRRGKFARNPKSVHQALRLERLREREAAQEIRALLAERR